MSIGLIAKAVGKAALAEVKKNPAMALAIVGGFAPKLLAKGARLAPIVAAALAKAEDR